MKKLNRGFTLLELLIAVSIFALLSAIAYGGLKVILDSREHTQALAERLGSLQLALTIMQRDIQQATHRQVRDQHGDSKPVMIGNDQSNVYLELTSNGQTNPLNLPRSSLRRIAYHYSEGELYRILWPTLDNPQDVESSQNLILDGLSNVEFQFIDDKLKRHDRWPPERTSTDETAPSMPVAIDLLLEYEDWGEIKRTFRLTGDLPVTIQKTAPATASP